jgi:hypothetical protein
MCRILIANALLFLSLPALICIIGNFAINQLTYLESIIDHYLEYLKLQILHRYGLSPARVFSGSLHLVRYPVHWTNFGRYSVQCGLVSLDN